jgi:hypothetical protein
LKAPLAENGTVFPSNGSRNQVMLTALLGCRNRKNMMHKTIPLLWSRWLLALSFFLILYGLAMVLVSQWMSSTLVGPLLYHDKLLQSAFAGLAGPELLFLNVMNGLIGAVTVAYALLIGAIAFEPFRKGERWAWNALTMSVVAWAILEAYLKAASGLGIKSMAHLGFLIAFTIPLGVTYRHFHPANGFGTG